MSVSGPISGFVVTYNRASLLETCLRSIRFADELIVVDKSSTDATPEIVARYADRVITVPWSPTVEATRLVAIEACHNPWVVFLDDDEMFSPGAIETLHGPRAEGIDAIALPRRHYILGRFDPDAYYWPEHLVRCFRRGTVVFNGTVHGGVTLRTDHVERLPADSPAYIEHLSHEDTAQWIERTNRYTNEPQRVRAEAEGRALIDFAHDRIDHWLARSHRTNRDDYPAAVALLRAIYDMVDRVKTWETERGIDGTRAFRERCDELNRAYDDLQTRLGIRTGAHRC
jgi:glycosyltransferase involved in cell wall biosynthesis